MYSAIFAVKNIDWRPFKTTLASAWKRGLKIRLGWPGGKGRVSHQKLLKDFGRWLVFKVQIKAINNLKKNKKSYSKRKTIRMTKSKLRLKIDKRWRTWRLTHGETLSSPRKEWTPQKLTRCLTKPNFKSALTAIEPSYPAPSVLILRAARNLDQLRRLVK